MQIVTLDFETVWDTDHSLSKMPPIQYVTHPRTEIISLALKVNNQPTECEFGNVKVTKLLESVDWAYTMVVGHNMSGFDAMLLAYRYGVKPKMWACTMQMARYLGHAKTSGLSLAKLAEFYEIGVKDSTALVNTKGKRLSDFTADEIAAMREYNKEDVELCYRLLKKLLPKVPPRELKLADMTTRMLTEPAFELDVALLQRTLMEEQERKHLMLLDIATLIGAYEPGMTDEESAEAARKTLASASKFSELLRACEVEVPMKPSPSNPEKMTPALAKTDQAFLDLQNHPDPIVAGAAQARLGVKSTILESRIENFLTCTVDGKLPVFLNYYGADTTGRWGGGGNLNQQNLPRVNQKAPKPTDALRMSLRAPKGFKVVVADLSGIELRVNHFLWKVPSSMALFQADPEKADLYKEFASELYGVDKEAVSKEQRQVGKVAHLGLGFGAGPSTFRQVAKLMAGIDLSEEDSADVVSKWRTAYAEIARGWKTCHAALDSIYQDFEFTIDPWGMCSTAKEGIKTPQGMIRYPNLRQETNEKGKVEWVYGEGRNKARIYAGKVTENIVQHLAREVIADIMLQVNKKYRVVLTVHDEVCILVNNSEAEEALDFLLDVMKRPTSWWPELVKSAEGAIGDSYGECK